jgi:protoporphyrinogen/coproporphyrinogen III oxidase
VTRRGRAVVVGGGIAGLTWALDALEAGYDVTLLERDRQFGGAVRRETLGPVQVDVGAESFAVTRPEVLELIDRLGIHDEVERPATHQAHVLTDGRMLALPPGLLGIPSEVDDVARLLGQDVADEMRRRDTPPMPAEPPSSLGQLVRERLGDRVADVLVDPVVTGVHATRADDAELMSVAPTLHATALAEGGLMAGVRALRAGLGSAGAPVASLRRGMGRLVERLEQELRLRGATLRTGSSVTSVQHDGTWRIRTDDDVLAAEVLCLAVPAHVAAYLLLDHTVATLLSALPTTDEVVLVTLLIADAELTRADAPVGSGVLVADPGDPSGPPRAKALTHASAKWRWLADRLDEDLHVVRLSFGGTHAVTRSIGDPVQPLVEVAHRELPRMFGGALGAPLVRASLVTRWHGGLARPVVGRAARLEEIDELLHTLPRLALAGSGVAGNGLAAVVARSHLEATRTL